MSNGNNPNVLYDKTSRSSGTSYWGHIPRSMNDAVKFTIDSYKPNTQDTERLNLLKSILVRYHKKLGIYSTKVQEHIDQIDNGSVLTGQQPIIMGGPGLIGNKIASLVVLTEQLYKNDLHLAPIYFVGDYDGLQKELTRQYYPNPISHNAHIIDADEHLPSESSIAAHLANLPPRSWLFEELEKLDANFRGFVKQSKGMSKMVLQERWQHIRTILSNSYNNADTLSEWAVAMWGIITNVVNDYGIVYLPTSLPEIRDLVSQEFLPFIQKRKIYNQTFKQVEDELINSGYKPTLPHRHDDYSPFILECPDDGNRMDTTLEFNNDEVFAVGVCPEDKQHFRYNVSDEEKLAEISHLMGPRVDTSQAIFQELMNIRIRVSGPGEIAYYALAAPAVRAIGIETPLFLKYKRAFYNAPWIEKLGKMLVERKQPSLHTKQVFEFLRERMKANRNKDAELVQEIEEKMDRLITEEFDKLVNHKQSIDIQKYLGWQYGRFTKHKSAQEVSWIWFDLAINTGITDYIESYRRMYLPDSLIGSKYYINSTL